MRDKLLIAAGSALILLGISGVVFEVLFRSSRKDTENMIYANSGQWANYSLDAYNTSGLEMSYSNTTASCLDSQEKIVFGDRMRKCKWIGRNSMESCSSSEDVRHHCPLTCNTCTPASCRDMSGEFKISGLYFSCRQIYYCNNPTFSSNCRATCEICTNSSPILPSTSQPSSPMSYPTQAPQISPSNFSPAPSPNFSPAPSLNSTKTWVSMDSIYGGTEDNSGLAVLLSNDGQTLFVGEPGAGLVRSFTHDFRTIHPKGFTIGNAYDPWFGSSIACSHDGSVVAVSSYKYDNYRGLVRVFIWDGVKWIKLGDDVVGDEYGQWFGWDIDISEDGKSIIAGVYFENSDIGYARVFDIEPSGWKKRGEDLVGDIMTEFGFSVALSSNGRVAAIGAPKGNYIEVYEWVSNQWSTLGTRINGSSRSNFGNSIALSSKDGLVLAVGANHKNDGEGAVYVYEWKELTSEWHLRGNEAAISGTDTNQFLGGRISLSEDGKVVAFNSQSKVGILVWDGSVWAEQGHIIAEGPTTVSLSGDGKILGVGRPHDDTIDFRAGVTSIFMWQ